MTEDGPIELNPALDRAGLAKAFATQGRVQIRDVLTAQSARRVQSILQHETPWGLAWQAGPDGPHYIRAEQMAGLNQGEGAAIQQKLMEAVQSGTYAFLYSSYPMVEAYLQRWQPGSAQEGLLEGINTAPFLDLIRDITGETGIVKADAQATLYAPGHFLSLHDDKEEERGRRVAYVLSMTVGEWRPEWGGYLNFYEEGLDVTDAYRPRFNALNLFKVPQLHSVEQVSLFSPIGRYAVTGWARDR